MPSTGRDVPKFSSLLFVLLLSVSSCTSVNVVKPAAFGVENPANHPAIPTEPSAVVRLWAGPAPESLGDNPDKDIPTLAVYLPEPAIATGAAMIVCPGGGYRLLASHEGADYALWLNQRGIAAFVLKYRLGSNDYRHPAMLHDIQRAVRLVRDRAKPWNVDPTRVGVMGSSAGGHLAATAATLFDPGQPTAADPIERQSSRPDLAILCYPVITMGPLTHAGSRANLLGKDPSPELVRLLSAELQVSRQTPPCFIWTTAEDKTVNAQNSLLFAQALSQNGVPFSLHIYHKGPHGMGLGTRNYNPNANPPMALLPWTIELELWLKTEHFAR